MNRIENIEKVSWQIDFNFWAENKKKGKKSVYLNKQLVNKSIGKSCQRKKNYFLFSFFEKVKY
jgi:hypothetical protein